ncbi:hypothetical protein Vqi01_11910 [Micromonospora qiuiae]|uniref:DUF4190 domain-containing protein n=1 Tax=Micromonospora qiuiae TaxID=502268 RepID=A0ABQ4J780_9ACTN|nr:hypothetical protein [Micromonospora qiuiae]GIJ26029.1 hypothetical protein Vqi01_11910 [Micromonospora qiuiae]
MSSFGKWWGRLSALLGTVVLSVFVPVAAWASTGTGELVVEAARRRGRGFGFFGFLSMLCCLLVVAVIVLLLIRLTRGRRR